MSTIVGFALLVGGYTFISCFETPTALGLGGALIGILSMSTGAFILGRKIVNHLIG